MLKEKQKVTFSVNVFTETEKVVGLAFLSKKCFFIQKQIFILAGVPDDFTRRDKSSFR